jgi:hypothetical protein
LSNTASDALIGWGWSTTDHRGTPWIGLYRNGNQVWLAIEISAAWGSTRGTRRIAERFPPLRERIVHWSMERLLSEYGRPLMVAPLVPSPERDRVILTELLKRDLAAYQLRQLLDRAPLVNDIPGHHFLSDEGAMVVELVVAAGKSKQFERIIRDEITRVSRNHTYELEGMLSAMRRAADVDVSDLAVECTGPRGDLSSSALRYLEARGRTLAVYRALQNKPVPAALAEAKERALAAIRARLP